MRRVYRFLPTNVENIMCIGAQGQDLFGLFLVLRRSEKSNLHCNTIVAAGRELMVCLKL
ncbi:protein of unknown function [Candidatus Filomicrobium marinum]|uniref:Uncharacterized protein n=1 Tax=Candidatus Filomicrobium marinum TaxID=1608628 RepID=A0A0D6JHJ2_9HYPH|nr:protein of unknown function [Candidatus Filomicrobium marinum]CPR20321.1 protein of unknown function [Candidatus Filomicrobium marinum]